MSEESEMDLAGLSQDQLRHLVIHYQECQEIDRAADNQFCERLANFALGLPTDRANQLIDLMNEWTQFQNDVGTKSSVELKRIATGVLPEFLN
ncbi:MAG: hypothetical protein R3D32_09660 [Nitratireductor sp.]